MLPRRTLPTILGLLLVALTTLSAPAPRVAAQTPAATTALNGVLVLYNGNVLSGAIRRWGDDYRVEVSGVTLQVPVGQVERFAATLEEAYEARRRERDATSAEAHVELAAWCLHLDLFDQAARELLDARTIDPQSPGLTSMEARLHQLVDLEAERNAPQTPVAVETAAHVEATEPETVVMASGVSELPATTASGPAPDAVVEIGTDAQIQFIRSIQPMLIRSCATGGCHQPGAPQQMQLDRWALEGNGNAEIVRRNLAAVLRELRIDDPEASPVLAWGRTVHGREKSNGSRPLSPHQATLLLEWLNAAAGVAIEPEQDTSAVSAPTPAVPTSDLYDAEFGAEATPSIASPDSQAPGRFHPRDAFDPEIFNRQQARRRAADEDASDHSNEAAEGTEAENVDGDPTAADESAEPSDPAAP